jgi:hypothetical protein
VTRWLSADTWAAPFGSVVDVVTAETANVWAARIADRPPDSIFVFTEASTRAVADPRAEVGQDCRCTTSLFDGVPPTSDVGGDVTGSGPAKAAPQRCRAELVTEIPESCRCEGDHPPLTADRAVAGDQINFASSICRLSVTLS